METIYHYTNLSGFFNIIKNKKLWLSASNNLNDHYEVTWFINKIHAKPEKVVTDKNEDLINSFWQMLNVYSHIPYICSFSKNGDLLSQWRAYADDGHGIAIGFNKDYFNFEINMPFSSSNKNINIGIPEVIYNEKHQNELIDEQIVELLKYQSSDEACDFINNSVRRLISLSFICKNPAFSEESEIRIIHTPMVLGFNDGKPIGHTIIQGGISEMQHRVSGKMITSYFELDFTRVDNISPIQEIILGPKSQLSNYDIQTF